MHNAWDELCKGFLLAQPKAFLQWVWPEATFVDTQRNELRAVKLETDHLLRVSIGGQDLLLHVEFQTYYDATMAERLLEYNVLVRRERKLPVWSVVVHLGADTPIKPAPLCWQAGKREVLTFEYDVLELARYSPEDLRRTNIEPLYALIPLTKGGSSREQIRETVKQFERSKQKDLASITLAFAELVLQKQTEELAWLEEEFKTMIESLEDLPMFQNVLRKREERGLEKGRTEGRTEERADMLLLIVQTRFPKLEALARQLVQRTSSLDLLKDAVVGVSLAQTEEEARQHLQRHLPS